MYGVYLVEAEVQEDHAREVHPDRQHGFLGMKKGMKMWEDWCLRQKKKNSQRKDPRTMMKTAREGTPVPKKKRWRVQKKRKEKKWKRKKRKKKKK